jgi:hypothetical protein
MSITTPIAIPAAAPALNVSGVDDAGDFIDVTTRKQNNSKNSKLGTIRFDAIIMILQYQKRHYR